MKIDHKINIRHHLIPWKSRIGCDLNNVPYLENLRTVCDMLAGKSPAFFALNPNYKPRYLIGNCITTPKVSG